MDEQAKAILEQLQEPFEERNEWFFTAQGGRKHFFWSAYIQRLDDLVGPDRWFQEMDGLSNGDVRCTIVMNLPEIESIKRVAIAKDGVKAFVRCCELLGVGRHMSRAE